MGLPIRDVVVLRMRHSWCRGIGQFGCMKTSSMRISHMLSSRVFLRRRRPCERIFQGKFFFPSFVEPLLSTNWAIVRSVLLDYRRSCCLPWTGRKTQTEEEKPPKRQRATSSDKLAHQLKRRLDKKKEKLLTHETGVWSLCATERSVMVHSSREPRGPIGEKMSIPIVSDNQYQKKSEKKKWVINDQQTSQ